MRQKFDAIVIGTGISGGWAAKELCENGLKTLVLERGRMVRHVTDYPTMFKENWDFKYRNSTAKLYYKLHNKVFLSTTYKYLNVSNKFWIYIYRGSRHLNVVIYYYH